MSLDVICIVGVSRGVRFVKGGRDFVKGGRDFVKGGRDFVKGGRPPPLNEALPLGPAIVFFVERLSSFRGDLLWSVYM